jgi:apoptosis-inducing factor 3
MADEQPKLSGPDLTLGIELSTLPDGTMLLGHARGEPVLLARRGDDVFAIGAVCTHYGAPLETGLLVGDTVRCPWHHACFSLRTGEALRAPALNPVSHWRVEQVRDVARQFTPVERPVGAVFVREKMPSVAARPASLEARILQPIIIVGGGAAGNAAAETLRHEGYSGRITMLSADEALPCDRPNLSRGYLAGASPEESNLLAISRARPRRGRTCCDRRNFT